MVEPTYGVALCNPCFFKLQCMSPGNSREDTPLLCDQSGCYLQIPACVL